MFKKRHKHAGIGNLLGRGRKIVDRPTIQYDEGDSNVCEILYPNGELVKYKFPEEGRPDLMRISFRIISKST